MCFGRGRAAPSEERGRGSAAVGAVRCSVRQQRTRHFSALKMVPVIDWLRWKQARRSRDCASRSTSTGAISG